MYQKTCDVHGKTRALWPRRLDVKARCRLDAYSTLLDGKARHLDADARRLDVTCGCDDDPSHQARRKWGPRRLDAASTARRPSHV